MTSMIFILIHFIILKCSLNFCHKKKQIFVEFANFYKNERKTFVTVNFGDYEIR